MTTDAGPGPTLTTGEVDSELHDRLTEELGAFHVAPTGESRRGALAVKVTDGTGALIGGLAGWTWGRLCEIELLWVREDSREDGWENKILRAAEEEARRRGCERVTVSSFVHQTPAFYRRHGYAASARVPGPRGAAGDGTLVKSLTEQGL
ncbi:GNAT family N-acetyltransferase [Streptomyces pactum]|uniref:GNAT family N-acetyltransferase n=1 Tax=Streptomyces pactum TaxID=68249 RepID=A0ABS0NE38_9ACTN|nr:GNAT family N-acetyltransferase [Streptomyces pactum]MBH5333432.1 GNAT family N-acetyltransferase [Streptomyces pactum]